MFTYDPSTDIGLVRLLINDRDQVGAMFQDEEVLAVYNLCDQTPRFTAAQLLETIAANEVLIQKRIRTLDLSTDGPAEAEALRELANVLRVQENETATFDVAEIAGTPAAERERWRAQFLRGGF